MIQVLQAKFAEYSSLLEIYIVSFVLRIIPDVLEEA